MFSKSHKGSANRVPLFHGFWGFGVNLRSNSEPEPPPPPKKKHFELRFRRKREEFQSEPSNLVQISKKSQNKTHFFFMLSAFEQTRRKRVPMVFFCFELCFRRNRAKKKLIEKPRFSQKPISVNFARIFPKS